MCVCACVRNSWHESWQKRCQWNSVVSFAFMRVGSRWNSAEADRALLSLLSVACSSLSLQSRWDDRDSQWHLAAASWTRAAVQGCANQALLVVPGLWPFCPWTGVTVSRLPWWPLVLRDYISLFNPPPVFYSYGDSFRPLVPSDTAWLCHHWRRRNHLL